MAQTEDNRSVTATPKALLLAAGVLLFVRVVDLAANFGHPTAAPKRAISWQTTEALENVPNAKKASYVKPPNELSPESQKELNQMLESCKESKKALLLQFYANWSDPCKKMEASSLSNVQVQEVINQHFMPVRVTDKIKERGRNAKMVTELQRRYRVFAFPTLLVIGNDGEQVSSLIGNCSSLTTYRFLSRTVYSLQGKRAVTSFRGSDKVL